MNVFNALRIFRQLHRHFENPYVITLLRLGFIKLKYFPYAIHKGRSSYLMLARPATTPLADLFVLREVLVEETYRDVLPLLPQKGFAWWILAPISVPLPSGSARAAKVDEAFCFEPEPDSFRLLRFNLAEMAAASLARWKGRRRPVADGPNHP